MENRVFDTLRDMTATLLDADEVIQEAGSGANFKNRPEKDKREDQCKREGDNQI